MQKYCRHLLVKCYNFSFWPLKKLLIDKVYQVNSNLLGPTFYSRALLKGNTYKQKAMSTVSVPKTCIETKEAQLESQNSEVKTISDQKKKVSKKKGYSKNISLVTKKSIKPNYFKKQHSLSSFLLT
jgi:hypothetical protein